MVGLAEVIQNIIVFSMNAKLLKLILESARLFKKAVDFIYFDALSP